jgi:hypothetical protein
MRQWFATALLVVGAAGTLVMWTGCHQDEVTLDEAAVNQKVDARLHQVLHGLLQTEQSKHASPLSTEYAQLRIR